MNDRRQRSSLPALAPTAAAPAQVSVFLLDDREAVPSAVRSLLNAEPGITVTGEAGTAATALARIPALRPDAAVLDVRLPDGDGSPYAGNCGPRCPPWPASC